MDSFNECFTIYYKGKMFFNMSEKIISLSGLTQYNINIQEWVLEHTKVPKIQVSPEQTNTINPYIMYDFGTVTGSIGVSFNTSQEFSGYCGEYMITFVAGNSCSINFPNTIKYNGGSAPSYVQGRTYEINICNGLAVVGEFY
jgi:hypothetical protein